MNWFLSLPPPPDKKFQNLAMKFSYFLFMVTNYKRTNTYITAIMIRKYCENKKKYEKVSKKYELLLLVSNTEIIFIYKYQTFKVMYF